MSSSLLLTLFFIQITLIISEEPIISRKCKISDAECLKTVAQGVVPRIVEGISEIGTETLDVMHIDESKFEMGRLKLTVSDANIKGLRNAVITNYSFDLNKNILTVAFRSDLVVKTKYLASGHLLILPITGDGDMTVQLKNLHIKMMIPFEIIKKNGEDVLDLKSYEFEYDVKDSAQFDLTNLFNGNKEMSNKLLTFMNDKWKTILTEFGKPPLNEVVKKIFHAVKTYLASKAFNYFVEL